MDLDGFYQSFVHLENFIPYKYEDLVNETFVQAPFIDFILTDMVYKHSEID